MQESHNVNVRYNGAAEIFDIFSVAVPLQVPLQKRALRGKAYELALAVFHVFLCF